jgi:hypothetical protein
MADDTRAPKAGESFLPSGSHSWSSSTDTDAPTVGAPINDISSPAYWTSVPLDADHIYLSRDFGPPMFAASLRYVREALQEIESGQEALNEGDFLDVDDHMNKAQLILTDAFNKSRGAADGVGIVIVAALCSLANRGENQVTADQVLALKRVLMRVVAEPYMSSEVASEVTLLLEDAGLDPDLAVLQYLGEMLADG